MSKRYGDEACADIVRVLEAHFKKQCYKRLGIKRLSCTRQENTGTFYIAVDHGGRMGMFEVTLAEYRPGWEMSVVERIDNWLVAL